MHVVGILGANLNDDGVARLAVDECPQAARARRPEHGVSLEVAHAEPLLDHFGAVTDPRGVRRTCVFSAVRTLAAPPQKGLPVLAILVLFDPGIDGLVRNRRLSLLL